MFPLHEFTLIKQLDPMPIQQSLKSFDIFGFNEIHSLKQKCAHKGYREIHTSENEKRLIIGILNSIILLK